ncbi:hypothetical protein EMCRGX_G026811 [Ephydatia muelleri]
MDDLRRMHVNAETITLPVATFRGATDTTTRPIYEGVLLKRCSLCWRPRYVKLVLDPTSHISGRPSSELLIYDPHQRKSKLNRIKTDSIVTIRASRDCFFQIFLSDGKILQFRTDSVEKQICWMASVKSALGKGNVFHVQVNTQSNLEHALLYCIEVNLPAHRVGQLDRILVLASPVNDINMFAWDLNRVLCFVESDVGIRMQLCRTCMGPQDTTITFMLSKQFIRPCLAFLCREARISEPPVSEHGAFVYNLNHVCGFSPPPAVPAPPPPQELPAKSSIPNTPSTVKDSTVPPGSSGILPPPTKPSQPPSPPSLHHPPPPPPPSAPVGGRHHRDRQVPPPPPPLSLAEDSGTGGSSSYFYFSPKDSDAIGFFGPAVPPRTIPRKGYECALPAVAQPYSNCTDWAWLPQPMYFEGPYQISSRVIITDTGTVVHEPSVLGSKSSAGGHAFGRPNMPLPPRRPQSIHRRTVEFQTAHSIAFGDPAIPPQVPAKSIRKSPSYPPAPPTAKRPNQLGTCQEGQDEDDEYIVLPAMAPVIARKDKPPPPLPSMTEYSPKRAASGPLRDEVVTSAQSSVEVAVAVDVSHTTTYSREQPPRFSPRGSPRPPPQEEPPSRFHKQKRGINEGHDEISWATDAPPLPPKVDTRGDDQAGLLDFEKPLVAPKPIPKPRASTRVAALRTSVSVNIMSES